MEDIHMAKKHIPVPPNRSVAVWLNNTPKFLWDIQKGV